MLDLVGKAGLGLRVTISSFSIRQLERVRELDARVPICLLVGDADRLAEQAGVPGPLEGERLLGMQRRWVGAAARARLDQVAVSARDLGREIVAYAAARGLELRAWDIRSTADMDRAIRMGAHGMTINWPDRLIRRLVEYMAGGVAAPEASARD